MSREPFILQEGAWFFADAHYAHYNELFYNFLSSLRVEDLPSQIILMGDIFDLLFGFAPNSIEQNRKMVDLLKRMSSQTQIIYLEGNHDFGLEPIFGASIRIVPRQEQPLIASFKRRTIALHHGDVLQGVGYELYTHLIRNPWIDRLLNVIDGWTRGGVIARLERYNRKKEPCRYIDNFEIEVDKKMTSLRNRYNFDYWVEGHYHQDRAFLFDKFSYRNLPAFACEGRWMELKTVGDEVVFEKKDANGI